MRKSIGIGGFGALVLTAVVLLAGMPATGSDYETSKTVDLMAGQNLKVGAVTVTRDNDHVYVTYKITEENWYLSETHVALVVTDDCSDCPFEGEGYVKNGNPRPGKFPYKQTHDPLVTEYKYTTPMPSDFAPGDYICFATHAVVVKKVGGVIVQSETGWAGDHDFPGKNWALYFCWNPWPYKMLKLPATIYADIQHPGEQSYWGINVITGGGQISTGQYVGWCVDLTCYISEGEHTFNLYAYYDENMPTDEAGNGWNQINWILNNRGGYTSCQVQDAIWYFTGDKTYESLGTKAKELVDNANTHG